MNNLEKNLAILEKKAARDAEAKNTAKNEEEKEKARLMQEISNLKPRIADLIKIGQKCQDLGIDFPIKNEMSRFGYDSRFEADGINHDLGFITKEFKIRYLGIKNGGFNGPWDFYTDGVESFSVSNKNYSNGAVETPQIPDMKQFLKQFGVFESAFYQWIESLNKAEEDTDEGAPGEYVKTISLRNLYENGIKSLTFGGTGEIIFRDGRYVLEHNALPFIEDGEELKFQFFADAGDGERFALGTSKEEHGVYLTKEEYELAVEAPVFLEAGKTYKFAGYDWTVCEVDSKRHTAVFQSHGVTSGAWPGYVMQKFGGKANAFYGSDIDGEDISDYDDKMQALYDTIKDAEDSSASYGKGLFLIGKGKVGFTKLCQPGFGNYCQALEKAAEYARLFGAASNYAWLGTVNGSNYVWCVYSNGNVYHNYSQYYDFVVAPAFNLDLSKIIVVGDEIFIKGKDFTEKSEDHPDSYRSIWKYGFDFTKDGKSFHLDPEMVSQIYEAITEDNGRNYVATYTSRKFTRAQYIAICDEVENLLADNSGNTEYLACKHVLGKGFDE